jgi:hypothetical protein
MAQDNKKMTEDEIHAVVSRAVEDAIAFVESEIDPDRNEAQEYFNGNVSVAVKKGMSKVVATKCRDAVRAAKPPLLKVFLSTDKPVEYIPRTQDDVQGAQQATAYAQWKFSECGGYNLLSSAIQDALVKKTGILKAFYDETSNVEFDDYTGLTDEEFAYAANDDSIEIIEHSSEVRELETPDGIAQVTYHDAKVSMTSKDGSIKIITIPPEDFFFDSGATTTEDAYVVGHKSELTTSDLVEMGYDRKYVETLIGTDGEDEADIARNNYADIDNELRQDKSMQIVMVYECFMKMDIENTGVARLYSFILGGMKKELLSYELADMKDYAVFEVDPQPHSFCGNSLVDILINDQDVSTGMWRGLLDNVAMANTPGFAYDDKAVNTADMLNNEVGRLVRVRGAPTAAIMPLAVPFTAGQTIPAMQYHDQLMEEKTGVSRVSQGLDPDALQGATATAINATVGAAVGQAEVMARNLAEGGMTQLFRIMLKLIRQHATAEEFMMIDGTFVPVDPRSWTADMNVGVNVGLGTGQDNERLMSLQQTLQMQMQIWQGYGPQNGLVSMTQIRNTLADIMKISGVHNVDRYWKPMTPEIEQKLQQQAAQAAQQQQPADPNAAFLQAEQMKAQSKAQTDMAKVQLDGQKAMGQAQLDWAKLNADDDLNRDQMAQDLLVDGAKILGQYGTAVDVAGVKQAQNAPREFGQ